VSGIWCPTGHCAFHFRNLREIRHFVATKMRVIPILLLNHDCRRPDVRRVAIGGLGIASEASVLK